jgi:DNA (cytosine-5)-methyltransferase 1
MMKSRGSFTFVDLFAGIGGFHAALSELGGQCVLASEIDTSAASIYEHNWNLKPVGDIVELTDPVVSDVIPEHDVLCAGFPCQPFSKSGKQEGFRDATRGTLFFNICQILEARKPAVILLENVRNLAGPRQRDTWNTIIESLRALGYKVSDTPTVFSPHLLPSELGGRPQVRERVFIFGVYVGTERSRKETISDVIVENEPVMGFDPRTWRIADYLTDDNEISDVDRYRLSEAETRWIDAWDDFVHTLRSAGMEKLPGFPVWADDFKTRLPKNYKRLPQWKIDFLRKNRDLYNEYRVEIDCWLARWNNLEEFPPSRRKLEWQAQDAESLWDSVMHFRPSGIRAKRATYLPALVAITQTSIIGERRRRITPDEAKLLQGLPAQFAFPNQGDAQSYKQLGNGVSVGAVQYVFRSGLTFFKDDLNAKLKRIA